jgi:hypothetical protein
MGLKIVGAIIIISLIGLGVAWILDNVQIKTKRKK